MSSGAAAYRNPLFFLRSRVIQFVADDCFVETDVSGLYGQCATSRHRVARVNGQVEKARLELVSIDLDRPQVLAQTLLDFDGFAQGALEHAKHTGNQEICVRDPWL